MATDRVIPPTPEQLRQEEAPDRRLAEKELKEREQRKLNSTLRAGGVAQMVIAVAVVLAICYVAKRADHLDGFSLACVHTGAGGGPAGKDLRAPAIFVNYCN